MLLKLSTPLAAPASYTPAIWVEDCDVWILGTVHLGSDSACEAEQLIEAVKLESAGVESLDDLGAFLKDAAVKRLQCCVLIFSEEPHQDGILQRRRACREDPGLATASLLEAEQRA